MDLNTLQLFCDVARLGSLAAAARHRGLDPSSVSRGVAAIEAELGVRLFHRTTRTLSLTEAGAVYLSRAEAVVNELEQARDSVRAISAGPAGTLRLTASVAFAQICIVPLIHQFRDAFPDLKLELLATDRNLDIVAERIDLAIRLAPDRSGELIGSRLMDTRYRVVASPAYLARAPRLTQPADLSKHRILLFDLPEFRSAWRFRGPDGQIVEVAVNGDVVISSALALRESALNGLGPALLANWLIDADIADGRLLYLFPGHQATATSFDTGAWLLYPSRAFLPAKVRLAIDFLRRQLART